MNMVAIENVHKKYGNVAVLQDIDLNVANGEFIVLVGPSGCGKSTLLRMIAGLEDTENGRILLNGVDLNDTPANQRDIAMVFQSYALYPHMSVAENMGFSLKIKDVPRAEIAARVQAVAEALQLSPLLARRPRELSGGQRQRVAIGRAMVRNPQVFLFDEPLSNLDAKLRVDMRLEIKKLHQQLDATMIYVTHDQIEAMTLADRIAIMNQGRIEQVATPLELYDRPRNLFVASFIGSPEINRLTGAVADGGERFVCDSGLVLPLPGKLPHLAGRRLVYAVRPEHFLLNAPGGLAAEVDVTEPTGVETLLTVKAGGETLTCTFRQRLDLAPGDGLGILPDIHRIHLFDAASGQRILFDEE
ncbi:sn-glycerol-3-phosphate ABC transporter ATP-binding protein UgpC [Brenneria populi subsp. brevivirga]|uniref:ABC transporter ATP-binding protein n=1 Tax=Brenneria populi TaxID=1505588 RepID=UPI002E18B630|nr:sn-glycerol-3-phosphate ABC transporter ATP-binding protein UgpC [Brenneria populi subsp. brevivirga]